jgi:hypothetical protein
MVLYGVRGEVLPEVLGLDFFRLRSKKIPIYKDTFKYIKYI